MKARVPKQPPTNARAVYTVILLSIYWAIHQEFGFSTKRLNQITAFLADFLQTEDLNTVAEELVYWADKHGIQY